MAKLLIHNTIIRNKTFAALDNIIFVNLEVTTKEVRSPHFYIYPN